MGYFTRDDLLNPIQDFDAERTYVDRRLGTTPNIKFNIYDEFREDIKRGIQNDLRKLRSSSNILPREEPVIIPNYRVDVLPIKDEPLIMPKYLPDIPL